MTIEECIELVWAWLKKEYGYEKIDYSITPIGIAYTELYDENDDIHYVQIYYDVEKRELIYCVVESNALFKTEEIYREHYEPEWFENLPYDALFDVYNDKFGWS